MSRSFVRTWALVATIMAVACFVFVLPMPDNVDLTGSARSAPFALKASKQVSKASFSQVRVTQVSTSQGMVDSTIGSKVSSAFMPFAGPTLRHDDPGWILVSVRPVEHLRVPSFDPPIRPG